MTITVFNFCTKKHTRENPLCNVRDFPYNIKIMQQFNCAILWGGLTLEPKIPHEGSKNILNEAEKQTMFAETK